MYIMRDGGDKLADAMNVSEDGICFTYFLLPVATIPKFHFATAVDGER